MYFFGGIPLVDLFGNLGSTCGLANFGLSASLSRTGVLATGVGEFPDDAVGTDSSLWRSANVQAIVRQTVVNPNHHHLQHVEL